MRQIETALYLAKVTGRPLAAVRFLARAWGDRAVAMACAFAVLIVKLGIIYLNPLTSKRESCIILVMESPIPKRQESEMRSAEFTNIQE